MPISHIELWIYLSSQLLVFMVLFHKDKFDLEVEQ